MKKAPIIVIVFAVLLAIGVFLYRQIAPINQPADNTLGSRAISIFVDEQSNNPDNLNQIKIATVTVLPDGGLVINTLQKDNADIKRLQQAIIAITARPALKLTGENEEIINGKKALVMKEFDVSKTNRNYPYAVAETLNVEFGIWAEVEE